MHYPGIIIFGVLFALLSIACYRGTENMFWEPPKAKGKEDDDLIVDVTEQEEAEGTAYAIMGLPVREKKDEK